MATILISVDALLCALILLAALDYLRAAPSQADISGAYADMLIQAVQELLRRLRKMRDATHGQVEWGTGSGGIEAQLNPRILEWVRESVSKEEAQQELSTLPLEYQARLSADDVARAGRMRAVRLA